MAAEGNPWRLAGRTRHRISNIKLTWKKFWHTNRQIFLYLLFVTPLYVFRSVYKGNYLFTRFGFAFEEFGEEKKSVSNVLSTNRGIAISQFLRVYVLHFIFFLNIYLVVRLA